MFCSLSVPGLPEGIQATLEALTQQVPALETMAAQQMTEVAPMLTEVVQTVVAEGGAPAAATGSISGTLGYPAEGIPPLKVVAFEAGTANNYFVLTAQNQTSYQIDNLPPGTYHVVAYTTGGESWPTGLAGGYTQSVPCGLSVDCTDHSLIDVIVTAGQVSAGADPTDWYAPDGTYPPMP
jgi:hypothetical protein